MFPKICGLTLAPKFMFSHLLRSTKRGRRHFQTDELVGRDLSTLVTQGHPLHGALRDGDRGCANPREDPPDPEDMPCNPIVPLKGLGQTAGDAVAAHASIRL